MMSSTLKSCPSGAEMQEIRAKMLAMQNGGASMQQVCEAFRVTLHAARRRLTKARKEANGTAGYAHRVALEKRRKEMLLMRQAGAPIREIAEKFGITQSNTRTRLAQARRDAGVTVYYPHLTEARIAERVEILSMSDAGYSRRAIAQKFGVDVRSIDDSLRMARREAGEVAGQARIKRRLKEKATVLALMKAGATQLAIRAEGGFTWRAIKAAAAEIRAMQPPKPVVAPAPAKPKATKPAPTPMAVPASLLTLPPRRIPPVARFLCTAPGCVVRFLRCDDAQVYCDRHARDAATTRQAPATAHHAR